MPYLKVSTINILESGEISARLIFRENFGLLEMKSINLETSASGFSTNHHTTHDIIAKYRQAPWSFAIYYGIHLSEIYVMTPDMLEPLYIHWEEKLSVMAHLNNPKIPVKFVRENGIQVYPINHKKPFDPDSINF